MGVVLRASWGIDGTGAAPMHDVAVRVNEDVITDIGPASAGPDDHPDDEVVELPGWTVLPGLIDAHAHTYKAHESLDDLRAKGRALLETGFVALRDLGSPDDALFAYRDEVVREPWTGPRIQLCGRILSAPSPGAERFGQLYRVCEGPEGFRAAVRAEVARDVDVIKVMVTGALNVPGEAIDPPQLTSEELHAIVDEARAHDLPVAAHAEGLEGIRLAVAAGVDSIEHGDQAGQDPAVLERMAREGIALVPTLALFDAVVGSADDPGVRARADVLRTEAFATVRAARSAGVRILCGPDVLTTHGPRVAGPTELRLLAEAGLPPAELVAAATGAAAATMRCDVGVLRAGAPADLIAVAGPVHEDPSLLWLQPPGAVMRAGRWITSPERAA